MKPKIVTDKHIDPRMAEKVTGRLALNAQRRRPDRKYRGVNAHDEDYCEVLHLAWENYAPLLTADKAMIEKARIFQAGLPRKRRDRCLNGVIILPPHHSDQERLLNAFTSGALAARFARPRRARPRRAFNVTLEQIDTANLALDLTRKVPKVIELCSCLWDDET